PVESDTVSAVPFAAATRMGAPFRGADALLAPDRSVNDQRTKTQAGRCAPERMSLMNFFPRLVLASVLPVALATAAHAPTVFPPPVIPDDDGTFFCLVTNVSCTTIVAKIAVVD